MLERPATVKTSRIAQTFRGMCGGRSARLGLFAAVVIIFAGRSALRPSVEAQVGPIVQENTQTGSPSSEWDVSGAGDPSIQGFATDISVNKRRRRSRSRSTPTRRITGSTSTASATTAVRARAWWRPSCRRRRCRRTSRRASSTARPDSLIAATGASPASWSTASATSGIYLAKLKRLDTGGASHIVFIVRDDARQADLVFQTSDTTWQAYNQYGGGSLYCNGPESNAGTVYACAGVRPR